MFVFFACKSKTNKLPTSKNFGLIPLNHTDSNFMYGKPFDTILPSGWSINYLVKNDSSKYSDVYIEIKKGNQSAIFKGESLLQLKNYFIPSYKSENETNIFLEHGCATDCSGLLVFNKLNLSYKDFYHVVSYDRLANKVVWLSYEDIRDGKPFQVIISDLTLNRDTTLHFKNLALGSEKEGYVDTVIYKGNSVIVTSTLIDISDYNRQRTIRETKIF